MPVYLDHAATTPLRPQARAAYLDAAAETGNPSSIHSAGQRARQRLDAARETIAGALGAEGIELILTSGGTESINTALKGIFAARQRDAARPILVVAEGEHHATMDSAEWLETSAGAELRPVPLDAEGRITVAAFDRALGTASERIALASIIAVNNEVGTVQDISALAAVAARHGVPLHVDAVAAVGHVPLDWAQLRRDSGSRNGAGLVALSLSAHKVGGPVGQGGLLLARDAIIDPLLHGGGQQRAVRSGSQDVPAAAAFAAAITVTMAEQAAERVRLAALRDDVIQRVAALVPAAVLNGPRGEDRAPGNVHLSFPGCEADSLLFLLDMAGVAASTGSACQAGIPEPSHVLRAMGRDEEGARGALRITLGWTTTAADIEAFLIALPAAYAAAHRAGFSDREVPGTVDSSGA